MESTSHGGGAIGVNCGTIDIDGYKFEGNTSASIGGAIYLNGWNATNIATGIFLPRVWKL